MAKQKETTEQVQLAETTTTQDLVKALLQVVEITKPPTKKTIANRKEKTAWTPADGTPKLKLKRKMYQHGLIMDPDFLSNEHIELLNKVRPGTYFDGYVKVVRRKDKGIDIDYPVKTAAQRMRLASQFKVTDLSDLLKRCIEEAENPKKSEDQD